MFKYPMVLYPTVVRGFVKGPIRCESIDGSELYLPEGADGVTYFQQAAPFVHTDGKTYFISHLQKKSPRFSLLYDPYIYHWGWFWKLQEPGKPGSESGIYWRSPGWRWQVPDANSNNMPWIFSKGYVGGHLD